MKLSELTTALGSNPDSGLQFVLPNGKIVPEHFHVTEVGRQTKDFIDCGGTKRTLEACAIQLWVADDVDHRITSKKFLTVLTLAKPIFHSDQITVEFEYQAEFFSQFVVSEISLKDGVIVVKLGNKTTACLAEEKCGVTARISSSLSVVSSNCGEDKNGGCC